MPVPILSDEKLKEIGRDLYMGKIFTSTMIRKGDENIIGSVFMVMIFLDEEQRQEMLKSGISVLYEYYDQAGPRSINGYPTFMNCGTLTKDQWEKVVEYHNKYKEAVEAV